MALAPTFHKIRMVAPATATSVTITTPEGASAGDTLYIWIKVEGTEVTITAPEGWTKIGQKRTTDTGGWQVALFELPNWDGLTTTYKIEWGGGSHGYNGTIVAFASADKLTPRNVTGSEGIKENASSVNAEVQGYATTRPECLPVTFVSNSNNRTATPAAGWTEDGDQADGPEAAHKTVALPAAETLGTVTHTMSSACVTLTIGFALQPEVESSVTQQPNAFGLGALRWMVLPRPAVAEVGAIAYVVELAETITGTDAIEKAVQKPLAETVTGTDAVTKKSSKSFAETLTGSDSLTKMIVKALSETITGSDAIARTVIYVRSLAETLTGTDAVTKASSKPLSETLTGTDSITKKATKVLADTITGTDSIKTTLLKAIGTYIRYLGNWVKIK